MKDKKRMPYLMPEAQPLELQMPHNLLLQLSIEGEVEDYLDEEW